MATARFHAILPPFNSRIGLSEFAIRLSGPECYKTIAPLARNMEFTTRTTAVAFFVLILLGLGITLATPMSQRTVFMMVLPALIIYGLVAIALGVKHGEYRARHS